MFTIEGTSTFAEVLDNLHTKIKVNINSGGRLKDLREVQVGVDHTPTAFPYLTLFPLTEVIERVYSTGYCDVNRTIRFQVVASTPKSDSSYGIATGITNSIKNLFYSRYNASFWMLKDSRDNKIVYSTNVVDMAIEDPVDTVHGIRVKCYVDIAFKCQIKIDILRHKSALDLQNSDIKEITKIIHQIYKGYGNTLLTEINTFNYGVIQPIKMYPAIAVISENAGIEPFTSGGADLFTVNNFTYVYSKFTGGPQSIYKNMDIIDKCRQILFANKYFLNRSFDYEMNTMEYGITQLYEDLVFVSNLNLIIKSFEPIGDAT